MKVQKENNYKTVYSIIRYAGGKTKAQKVLSSYIPSNVKKIVSPFLGGGSFELFLNKNRNIEIEGYDIFDYLVNFWNVILNEEKKSQFLKIIRNFEPNRDFYYKKREELLNIYKNNIEINNIYKAVLYFFSHQFSYGPMFLGWPSSVYLKEDVFKKQLKRIENFNSKNFFVGQSDFENVMLKNKKEFLYLDPPYFLSKESKVFKGIYPNSNWAIHHNNFDHKKLCKLLKEHEGGFLLSYNDCPEIREMYKDFDFDFPEWHYSFSQGELRIGLNRKIKENYKKKSHEILIFKK